MRITMFETRRGTPDGHTIRQFEKGLSYDLRDELARYFLRQGAAKKSSGFGEGMGGQNVRLSPEPLN